MERQAPTSSPSADQQPPARHPDSQPPSSCTADQSPARRADARPNSGPYLAAARQHSSQAHCSSPADHSPASRPDSQAPSSSPADHSPARRPDSQGRRSSAAAHSPARQPDVRPSSGPYLAAVRQRPGQAPSSSPGGQSSVRHRDARPSSGPYLAAARQRDSQGLGSSPAQPPPARQRDGQGPSSSPAQPSPARQPDARPSSTQYLAAARLNERFQQLRSEMLPQLLECIDSTERELGDGPPQWSQKPWGFASKAGRFSAYLDSHSVTAKSSDDAKPEYLQHLRSSRAFFSPHSAEAMAEALGAGEAYGGLSGSLVAAPAPPEAVADLRTHLKGTIDRAWSDEALRHGVNHSNAGQYSEAIKSYNRALELCPANLDARVAKGAALANQHHYSDAIAEFEAVVKADSQNRNAISYLATVKVAAAAAAAGGGRDAVALQAGDEAGRDVAGSGEAVKRALELVTGQGKEKKSRKEKEKSKEKDRKKDKKSKSHKRDKDRRRSRD